MIDLLKSLLYSAGLVALQTLMASGGGYKAIAVQWLYLPATYLVYRARVVPASPLTLALVQWAVWFLLLMVAFGLARALERERRQKLFRFGDCFALALGAQFILLSLAWDRIGSVPKSILLLYYPAFRLDHSQNTEANIGAPFLWVGPLAVVYASLVAVLIALLQHYRGAQAASPNGGPAEQLGNSGVGGGPPSVS